MQKILKKIFLFTVVMLMSSCLVNNLNAQTPASLPGATPGVTSSTGGDGSPEVPFDGGMSLLLLASGVGYAYLKLQGSRERISII